MDNNKTCPRILFNIIWQKSRKTIVSYFAHFNPAVGLEVGHSIQYLLGTTRYWYYRSVQDWPSTDLHGMEELLHEHIVAFYSRPPSSMTNLENMSQGLGQLAQITSVICLRPTLSCVTTEASLMWIEWINEAWHIKAVQSTSYECT